MNTKHLFPLFFIIISNILLSCNRNDISSDTESTKFSNDLKIYVQKQKSIINKSLLSRSNATLTFDNIIEIANSLDSCSQKFIDDHPELVSVSNSDLTEDDLYAMSIDEEALLEFAKENYSSKVYNAIYNTIYDPEYTEYPGSSTSSDLKLPSQETPSEKDPLFWDSQKIEQTIIANLEVVSDFKRLTIETFSPSGLEKELQGKSKDCIERYKLNIKDCNTSFAVNMAFGVLSLFITTPTGAGATLSFASMVYTTYEYNNCISSAKSSLQECK